MFRQDKTFLGAIFLLSLFLSLAYLAYFPQFNLSPDARDYDALGWSLARGKGYCIEPGLPDATREPLYPFALSVIYRLASHNYFSVRLTQALVNALTCAVLYLIGRQVFGQESARLAVLLAAVYPAFIVYTGYLLNETVFNFLLCLAVFILIRGLKKGFLGWYIISGIIFGIGILCKASFLLFPLFIGAAILVFLRKKRKVIIPIFAVCVAAYAVVSPWAIRNYKVFGLFIPVKTGSGVALWAASYPAWAGMKLVGKGGYPEHRIEFIEAEPLKSLVHGLSEAEADRKMSREAKENIRNHPVIFARFCLKRAALLWQYPIGRELLGQRNVLLSWLLMFLHYLLLFLAIAGMALSLSTYRNRLILVIFLVPLYFTLIYALTYGHPRYQFPAIPYILFFASYGFIRLKGGLCRCG